MERHDPSEVQPGDVVTIEKGTPGEPGHYSMTGKWSVSFIRYYAGNGWKITRITRPALPIPTEPGTRFWAVGDISKKPREYLVTDERCVVDLTNGKQWGRQWFEERSSVVSAPEPETVPVPADIIREAEGWLSSTTSRTALDILRRIVRAVREREGES